MPRAARSNRWRGWSGAVFTILLYHSPDLTREAAGCEIDLYLAGHTHGGQIRLPLYGALVTSSAYGRRYASGLFTEGETTIVVSCGIGFEGGGLPHARFLCHPEIVSIDLMGEWARYPTARLPTAPPPP